MNQYYEPGKTTIDEESTTISCVEASNRMSNWQARIIAGALVAGLIFAANKGYTNAQPEEKAVTQNDVEQIEPVINPEVAVEHPKLAAFVSKYGKFAKEVERQYGLPAQVIMAQAILESGYGESDLTKNANNFFGLKAGKGWQGPTFEIKTKEYTENGRLYIETAKFKKFDTPEEGWLNYGELITTRGFYDDAVQVYKETGSQTEYLRRLVDGNGPKYATDPHYADKVLELVNLQRALEDQPALSF